MSLSAYDILAFDGSGLSCDGSVTNWQGNKVEIYKNWLYIHSPSMWKKDGSYCKPVIAEIQEGSITLAGFSIAASRGKTDQNSIFTFVTYQKNKPNKDHSNYENAFFGGIGAYGWKDEIKEIIEKSGKVYNDDWCNCSESIKNSDKFLHYANNMVTGEKLIFWNEKTDGPYNPTWLGITQDTLDEFFNWLTESNKEFEEILEWVQKCKSKPALKFNQGNAYFAKHLDFDCPVSEAGDQEVPLLQKMLKK